MHDHRSLGLLIVLGAASALLSGCAAAGDSGKRDGETPDTASECPGDGSLAYLCGPQNAEDLVRVGSTRWLIASSYSEVGAPDAGTIYLIESDTKTYEALFPGDSPVLDPDTAMFPDCPSIDFDDLQVHGLAIRETEPDTYRLYATAHGGIEAIQAWRIDATGEKPSVTWVGCVPLPDDVYANGVAILEDGGFVTTKFIDPTSAGDPYAPIQRGEVNGGVYEWHPGGAVTAVRGTELSGANGIEVSADGRYLFVAAYGGHEIVRFDFGPEPGAPVRTPVEIAPDNLRWTADDALLTVGTDSDGTGWTVLEIDPSDMSVAEVAAYATDVALQEASTALEVGDEVWIGTWEGDRMAYFPAP